MRASIPWVVLPLISLSEARAVLDSAPIPDRPIDLSKSASSDFITLSDGFIVLDSTSAGPAIHTIDYGRSIDGIPAFEVVSTEGDTSVFEITYGESSAALKTYMVSDLHQYVSTPKVVRY